MGVLNHSVNLYRNEQILLHMSQVNW